MRFVLSESQLRIRNSTTRIPFRYGKACLIKCPQALLRVKIDTQQGSFLGHAGDCLPPGWFDKRPGRSYAQQIQDMLSCINQCQEVFASLASHPVEFFSAWSDAYDQTQVTATSCGWSGLLASFGLSLIERAVIDAMCRAAGVSFAQGVRRNILGIDAGSIHPELIGLSPADWLPKSPRKTLFVRHTIGLADPIRSADISPEDRVNDGLPQSLEEYVGVDQIHYFKIKVSNRLDQDLQRLRVIAETVETDLGDNYCVTIDGNEQYGCAEEFDEFIRRLREDGKLAGIWRNTLAIEQPLERSLALEEEHTRGVKELSGHKPVIIDESDSTIEAFRLAKKLGYRGVSSKCCKGVVKSLLNAGLAWVWNEQGKRNTFLMTGEDLCCVGVVPVQQDLCLVANLGLSHLERNGHHYHPGLGYLPGEVRANALESHPDFYAQQRELIGPQVRAGQFHVGSLHCPGFGYNCQTGFEHMTPVNQWDYESLGLE